MLVAGPVLSIRASMIIWLLSGGGCMGLYCFLFLAGGVGLGIHYILAISAPWVDVLATGGDCFVYWGQSECLVLSGFLYGLQILPGVS